MKAKKRALLGCVGLLLAAGEAVLGQSPADLSTARSVTTIPASTQSTQSFQSATVLTDNGAVLQPVSHQCCQPAQVSCDPCNTGCRRGPKLWASFEYLYWELSDGDTPALVTLGDVNDQFAGALGQPGTRVIFGGPNAIDHDAFSGARATIGAWLNCDWGVELSGFLTENRTTSFSIGSNSAGVPGALSINRPYFEYDPAVAGAPRENSYVIADPIAFGSGSNGSITIDASTRLWGAEFNGLRKIVSGPTLNANLIVGFRYMGLDDSLAISAFADNPAVSNAGVGFDIRETSRESFTTQNHFYGGQVGGSVSLSRGAFSVDLLGKVALGNNHQVVSVGSTRTEAGVGLPVNAPGPNTYTNNGQLLVFPTNAGRQERDEFSVIPQVQAKLGYSVTQNVRATVAYDFIYWSDVVRAGDQIDRRVNTSQSTLFGNALNGQAFPQRQFNASDFFAHGISVGLELRY